MNTTAKLTAASAKMTIRNRQSIFFALFMPIIIMLIFGLIGFDKVSKIRLGVVTSSPSEATTQLVDQIKHISAFDITTGTEQEERAALEKGDRSAVLILPDALLSPTPAKGAPTPATVTVLANAGQPQQSQTAVTVLGQILDKMTLTITKAPQLFSLDVQQVNSRNLKYIDFLLPGIVALAIMQMSVFSVAFVFVDYKEKGILKRLLATPMKPRQFVTANVITRLCIAFVQAAILIAVGVLIFHAHVLGSVLLLLPIILLGGVMFLGLGFAISGLAKTVDAVPAIANLIVFPMLFLGGTFFPLDTMPVWLQHIVKYLPLTYLSGAIRSVMVEAADFQAISHDLIWMLIWAVVLVFLAIFSFSFEEKRV